MSSNNLTEIVIKDEPTLSAIIGTALKLQSVDEAKKDYAEGVEVLDKMGIVGTRKEIPYGMLCQISSKLGIKKEYIDQTIEPLDLGILSFRDNEVLKWIRRLNLRNSEDQIYEKAGRIHGHLCRMLKRAKRFKPKIYTSKEIEEIYGREGIIVNGDDIVKSVFKYKWYLEYEIEERIDNDGNKRYRLHSR